MRMPIPTRADSIGPWVDALTFICYLGAITNASLIYLLKPFVPTQSTSTASGTVQEILQAVGNATHIKTLPAAPGSVPYTTTRLAGAQGNYALTTQALVAALLCALASEHGFILIRSIVKHLFERMLWQGSKEEAYTRGLNWQLRRDYIKSHEGEVFEKEINRLTDRRQRDLQDVQEGKAQNTKLPSVQFWQKK